MRRWELLLNLLEQLGIDRRRARLEWISASEGARFAEVVKDFTDTMRDLGAIQTRSLVR